MEDFVTITLTDAERQLLERATGIEKGRRLEAYILQAALDCAKAELAKKPSEDDLARQRALMMAYKNAMRYDDIPSIERSRVARRCLAMAKDGRDAAQLPLVVGWIRQVDNRFRQGQAIPIEEIARQWPAWEATTRPVTPTLARRAPVEDLPPTAPQVGSQAASSFGAYADWDEL